MVWSSCLPSGAGVLRRHGGDPAGLAFLRHLLDEGHGGLAAEFHDDLDFGPSRQEGGGHDIACHRFAVDEHDRVCSITALDPDVACHAPEHPGGRVARPVFGEAGVDHQPVVGRTDPQDVFRRGLVDPGNGSDSQGFRAKPN